MLLHATMIAGLAAIVLPLLLRQLHQAQVRRVEWGAMMFLTENRASRLLPAAWRDWTLTLLRMGLIASLALALAQPMPAATADVQRPGLTILIMDRSGSMSVDSGGKSRFDLARRAALNILAALPSGDEAAVIFAPESFGSAITSDLQQIAARISDVRQSNGRADLAAALNAAGRLLQSSRTARRNVFLISDRQALSWRDMTDAFAANWHTQLTSTAGARPNLNFLPIGTPIENSAVVSVEAVDPYIISGKPFAVELHITNFSLHARREVSLTFSTTNGELNQSLIDLPAKTSTTLRRTITLSEPGSQLVSVKLAQDAWPADDALDLAVFVNPSDAKAHATIDQNLSIGEPIVAGLPDALPEPMTVDGPTSGGVEFERSVEGQQARYSATNRPGVYRLHYRTATGSATMQFVVRPNRDESDLTDLSNAELSQTLSRFGFHPLSDPSAAELSRQINPTRIEPWQILLCTTVLLSAIELTLSRRWLMPIEVTA